MITHPMPTGWQIIYQRAHALLAAQLAMHWRVDQRPVRWIETLAAITQHDDGGREWEGKDLLTPAGAPKDFKLGAITLEQPAEAVMHAQYQGQYIALLQSMHSVHLFKDFAPEYPEIATFCDEQMREQAKWRKALKMNKAEADSAYALMYWCDAFSLILCHRQMPSDGRKIEIGAGPDGTVYFGYRPPESGGGDPRAGSSGGEETLTLTVEPYPFDEKSFEVSIETTLIDGLTFKNDAELVSAMKNGRIERMVWRFEK